MLREQEIEKVEFKQKNIILSCYHYQPITHMKKDLNPQEVLHLPICLSQKPNSFCFSLA